MKILFINNYFSPSINGWGYRQLCEEIADGLAVRGHDIHILTSTENCDSKSIRPYPIHRVLHLEPDWDSKKSAAVQFFFGRRQRELQAIANLKNIVHDFQPDIIFIWHAIGISKAVLKTAEEMDVARVAYYLADYQPEIEDEYLNYWRGNKSSPVARFLRRTVASIPLAILAKEGKPIKLNYENVACVSNYVRERLVSQNLISQNAVVIHNGVNLDSFIKDGPPKPFQPTTSLKCLVVGRLVPDKGIHTVIEGFAKLGSLLDDEPNISLTLVGDGPSEYLALLKEKVAQNNLENLVVFQKPVPRRAMPEIFAQHDVLIFPSEYDEPLARALQEGMIMGLFVIGTTTGGSGELLIHNKTGFTYEPGNPDELASQLVRLCQEQTLASDIARRGQEIATEYFTLERMIDEVESYLHKLTRKN